ncbi:CLUMA_CG021200, isoform A [Clunio marinus]|uniref:CLUMA_CG021200, isoform A n=1 Tax=Clunio marinus TaxID=568069 RepID=A0A1J1J918_9DIPT|nr:CLUMA_CG021200, isoform A [Clunio marinus]
MRFSCFRLQVQLRVLAKFLLERKISLIRLIQLSLCEHVSLVKKEFIKSLAHVTTSYVTCRKKS